MESSADRRFFAREPSLRDARDGYHLLVWGALAHWMVVDDELSGLLRAFDGRRTVRRILRDHAVRKHKPHEVVVREAEPVIRELLARGILGATKEPPPPDPEPARLANVTVNLTNRCNLRCRWCYNEGRTTAEMPPERLMAAIERSRTILDRTASFIVLGGEPFIDPPRLWTALDRAREIFAAPALISTNGTLVDERSCAELARRRVEVQVSLDSPDPERHDAVRGAGVHAKAVAAIQRLVDAGVYTIMSMVYTAQTIDCFEPYLALAARLRAREARFIPLRMVGGGAGARSAAPDQFAAASALLEVLGRHPEFQPLLARDYFSILGTLCRSSARRTSCGIGRRVVFIDADGAVYPCPNHAVPRFQAGSLGENDLETIVKASPVMCAIRERCEVSAYDRCSDCAFRHWCAGDCRGEVLALTGDHRAPSPHCAELERVFVELLWLIARGDRRLGAAPAPSQDRSLRDTFL